MENTNKTTPMSKREKAIAKLGKLCFSKSGPAVNYQHIEKQMEKIKMMDMKGVK